jgi:hypothetical protein
MICIYRVNIENQNKYGKLAIAREEIKTLRLLLRIIKDLQYITTSYFATLSEMVERLPPYETEYLQRIEI